MPHCSRVLSYLFRVARLGVFTGCPRRVDRVSQMKPRHPPPFLHFSPLWTVLPLRPPARALLGNHNLVLSPSSPSWRHFNLERSRVEFLSNLSCELSDHRGGLDIIAPWKKSRSLPFVFVERVRIVTFMTPFWEMLGCQDFNTCLIKKRRNRTRL